MISELTRGALGFVSYFAFREELLSARPQLLVADESEILGGFVSGVDFVAHVERHASEDEFGAIVADATLQRHVDRWLGERYENGSEEPPPGRHVNVVADAIERLAAWSIPMALQANLASREAGSFALKADSTTGVCVSGNGEIRAVPVVGVYRSRDRFSNSIVRSEEGKSWQTWVVSTPRHGPPTLAKVNRRPSVLGDVLAWNSLVMSQVVTDWYLKFQERRGKNYDTARVQVLSDLGLPPSVCIGLVRAGLDGVVLKSVAQGAPKEFASNVALNDLSKVVDRAYLERAPAAAADAISIGFANSLRGRQIAEVLELTLKSPLSTEMAVQQVIENSPKVRGIQEALAEVCAKFPAEVERAASGEDGARNFLTGKLAAELVPPRPPFADLLDVVREKFSPVEVDAPNISVQPRAR
ncbi:hypothetical protein GCM10025875_34200 [Litorihabitans aurantiacus]|uniref:Uncharacterized protein n=2 Tax=Litorihabitans aurantiacus TaxID=1930061 RepID=A0AA38CSE0_9MICO|nr:hypothetical protein GCM10025875_34200 [Litorihabitans aurantiacus]